MLEGSTMTVTTPFTTFYLDVTGEHAEEEIGHALMQDGIITFDTIQSTEELLHLSTLLGTIVRHRDANEAGLTRIVKRSDIQLTDGYQAFTTSHLPLHTDGSSLLDPATLLVLWCAQPAKEGGMSLFVDGKQIYHVLAKEYPHVLQALAAPDSALFKGSGRPLYSSVFSTLADGMTCIRFRYDSLGTYTAPVQSVLPIFLDILRQYTISFTLHKHQGYIVQNGRWLHGRTAFRGQREIYRVLIQTNPASRMSQSIHFGFNPDV